jgi:hypothetical protein
MFGLGDNMDKLTYQWYQHLCRRVIVHDDYPDQTDKLLDLGLVEIVKTWVYKGESRRTIQVVPLYRRQK